MKKELSTFLLSVLFIIFLVVLGVNIVKTAGLYTENNHLSKEIVQGRNIKSEIASVSKQIDNNLISIQDNVLPVRSEIFELSGHVQNNYSVNIISAEQVESRLSSDYQIVSYLVVITGAYTDLLKAGLFFEKTLKSSKLSAVNMRVERMKNSGKPEYNLNMELYVQGVIYQN